MAIKTQTITMRQGNKSDYQPSKMLSGELAVINDTEELHFSPKTGKSIRVATENDIKELENKIPSGGGENPGGGSVSFSGKASDVSYDDTGTNLGADNVQDAIGTLSGQKADQTAIPTKTSQLTNDSGFLTEKPKYTASEVGADASGTAQTKVSEHNVSEESHSDIRLLIFSLTTKINGILDSEDVDLDQLSELVAYIKANRTLIESVTTNKVNVSDIIDNLTTSVSNKPLSAKQGVQLKALIDAIAVPTKTSQLHNDSGFITKEDIPESSDLTGYEMNPLYGKKVSFLGDSICAGADDETSYLGGYGKIIADRNNMVYENVARGGATVTAETYTSTDGSAKDWLSRMITNMSADADYAIIEGGINDAWQFGSHGTITIGAMTDGYNAVLDDTTYYGAFESMLKQLVTRFKGKKVGYIAVPKIHELYDSNRNAPNFYHIAIECCAKWGVPVCDLNTIVPSHRYINEISENYTGDGTHPTEEGYRKYYCDQIESWMKTLTTGGNNTYSVAIQAIEEYTKGFNDAIKALQDGKLDNTGVSFRKALLPLADGTTIEIDVLTAIDGSVIIPFINQVPISIDTDGSVFNGSGYQEGKRLSSSGVAKDQEYAIVTGFIPAKGGDIIRIWNCLWGQSENAYCYICAYDANFNHISAMATQNGSSSLYSYGTTISSNYSWDDNGDTTLTLLDVSNIAYIRVSTYKTLGGINPKDMIVTVNEEIK